MYVFYGRSSLYNRSMESAAQARWGSRSRPEYGTVRIPLTRKSVVKTASKRVCFACHIVLLCSTKDSHWRAGCAPRVPSTANRVRNEASIRSQSAFGLSFSLIALFFLSLPDHPPSVINTARKKAEHSQHHGDKDCADFLHPSAHSSCSGECVAFSCSVGCLERENVCLCVYLQVQ